MHLIDEPSDFTSILLKDVEAHEIRLLEKNTAQHRRDYVRTTLSGMEGLIWFFKVQVFERRKIFWVEVSNHEMDAIFERGYSVGDNGVVKVSPKFSTTAISIKLLARILKRALPTFDVETRGPEWELVKKAIEVRNRIAHPKSVEDLLVSDDEVEIVRRAFRWTIAFILIGFAALKEARIESEKQAKDAKGV